MPGDAAQGVVGPLVDRPVGGALRGAVAVDIERAGDLAAIEADNVHRVAGIVEGPGRPPTVTDAQLDQAADGVMAEHRRRPADVVGDGGGVGRQIAVGADPAGRRRLGGHPARVVVGVGHQAHIVGSTNSMIRPASSLR